MNNRIVAVVALGSVVAWLIGAVADGSEENPEAIQRNLATQSGPKGPSTRQISADNPAAIAKLIDDINAAVRTNKQRMLSIITINTDVAATTLEREKAETGMTFGDVYVAHSLALATKKKFRAIVALHKSGKSWAQIARSHNVTLKGSNELIKEMQKQ